MTQREDRVLHLPAVVIIVLREACRCNAIKTSLVDLDESNQLLFDRADPVKRTILVFATGTH